MRRVFLCVLVVLVSCNDGSIDQELDHIIRYQQLTGNPIKDAKQQVSDIHSPKAQLGKLLFFSKVLSGQQDTACASCHHPLLGGDDDLSFSVGVNPIQDDILGVKRKTSDREIFVPRNAPTTFNSSLWQKHLFHDGRVERLNDFSQLPAQIGTPDEDFGDVDPRAKTLVQAQVGFPVTSEHEMRAEYKDKSSNDRLRDSLVENIIQAIQQRKQSKTQPITWENLFREVYHDETNILEKLITFERIQELIGEYEHSQLFINTAWKEYIEGNDKALSLQAKRGAVLFYTPVDKGGAGCVNCHSGDFFTDEKFHVIAIPQIGFGKDINGDDTGRYLRTGVLDDRYAFRTPSLINVEHTAPYGHSGAYQTLDAVIRHHLNPEQAIEHYDFTLSHLSQKSIINEQAKKLTQQAFLQLKNHRKKGLSKLDYVSLNDHQINDIVAFMKALTDPCIESKQCLQPWVPTKKEPNPDGMILYFDAR